MRKEEKGRERKEQMERKREKGRRSGWKRVEGVEESSKGYNRKEVRENINWI
jgi:hypothetical protein